MKRKMLVAALFAAILPLTSARGQENEDGTVFGTRVSAEADYKITKGLHLYANEELRFGGDFSFDRSYTGAGLSYKICSWLKSDIEYNAIAVAKTTDGGIGYTDWRHRGTVGLMASLKYGPWRFSVREKVQGTYRTKDINEFQKTRFLLESRTRLKVAYKFYSAPFEPYALCEMKVALNGPKWSAESFDTDLFDRAVWEGHNDVYVNRWRAEAGVEWLLDARSAIKFYCLYDRCMDREIDSNKEGTALKVPSVTLKSDRINVGVGYVFSF